jgi:hypothetical protein
MDNTEPKAYRNNATPHKVYYILVTGTLHHTFTSLQSNIYYKLMDVFCTRSDLGKKHILFGLSCESFSALLTRQCSSIVPINGSMLRILPRSVRRY